MYHHNDYIFKKQIGEGGMATVWLAEHKHLHQPVAIKVLNREFVSNGPVRKLFLSEARTLFRINHPNIVRVTHFIEEQDMVAFVMDYLEGCTLKEWIEQKGPLEDAEIRDLFGQILEAVRHIHTKNIIHRDIKPSNFIRTIDGAIKLLDFGIAKHVDPAITQVTQTTLQMGTPMYMSPEQVRSTKKVTRLTDIYSLGLVLWQMVAGRLPYNTDALTLWELQNMILNEPLPATGTLWDRVIERATHKDPGMRYQTCNSFMQDFLMEVPPESLPLSLSPTRSKYLLYSLVSLAAVAGGVVFSLFIGNKQMNDTQVMEILCNNFWTYKNATLTAFAVNDREVTSLEEREPKLPVFLNSAEQSGVRQQLEELKNVLADMSTRKNCLSFKRLDVNRVWCFEEYESSLAAQRIYSSRDASLVSQQGEFFMMPGQLAEYWCKSSSGRRFRSIRFDAMRDSIADISDARLHFFRTRIFTNEDNLKIKYIIKIECVLSSSGCSVDYQRELSHQGRSATIQ